MPNGQVRTRDLVTTDVTGSSLQISPSDTTKIKDYIDAAAGAGASLQNDPFVGDGVSAGFNLSVLPLAGKLSLMQVTVGGVLMSQGSGNDYTVTGTVLAFTFTPPAGVNIQAQYFK
jgi:hypothetical protein